MVAGCDAFKQYDVASIPLPANLKDDLLGRPAFYRRQREILADLTERQWRELRAVYYALVTEIDLQLGRVLDAVEAAGELDNTVVIVSSDHGRYLGAHGFDNHNFAAFEESYRIPLVMAGPGIAHDAATSRLVSLPDLCPTILELTGAEPIRVPDSKSIVPLLCDPKREESNFNACYAEYHGTRYLMTQRVFWQGDWKFVFNGFDYDELYNLADDPHELRNLANDPAQRDRVRTMMVEIWRRVQATNDRPLAETHYSPMRFGAVGPEIAKG